ncbi:dTDP-4-dehydrorhamnose reductase [Paenibacillus hexagrammi]|uniref:dTDP-4-dehydrorhamnose reductase n=1 Tax=Paenibacillus hexagrammi TaxID=2908839 RepID=A0ABY3SJX8_9BACL|nr:dTDP-4-dehydrorhamnose reductase [Paenibacillus sp. YPD9-1]UJF34271.1 dTDP-4-dehydrorhamnose reductase [Paenibacillus sp. YPD9-1]
MRVLVTGAEGQLGLDIAKLFKSRHEVQGLSRKMLDVTDDAQCFAVIGDWKPDVIIHCAAYTSVDLAETNEDIAYKVNAMGSRNIAVAAEKVGAKICYISTDYVFDGTSNTPYREHDMLNPQNIYGKSKRAGEELVQSLSSRYFIVRTSWLYGLHGANFVKTIIKLARERDGLKIVNDQTGSPTYTVDLTLFLEQLIKTEKYGIYHASNSGSCSWFELASAVFEELGNSIILEPCLTKDFPRPAYRPSYSVLEHMAIRTNGFDDLRPWREGLQSFFKGVGRVLTR